GTARRARRCGVAHGRRPLALHGRRRAGARRSRDLRPVNLLPTRYRPARATGERRGIGYIALGVLAVLLVMVIAYVVTNNSIKDANHKAAEAQAEQAAAQAKVSELQPFGDFAQLKQARFAAVQNVAQLRFDYERMMRELALVMPHESYLTTFSASGG